MASYSQLGANESDIELGNTQSSPPSYPPPGSSRKTRFPLAVAPSYQDPYASPDDKDEEGSQTESSESSFDEYSEKDRMFLDEEEVGSGGGRNDDWVPVSPKAKKWRMFLKSVPLILLFALLLTFLGSSFLSGKHTFKGADGLKELTMEHLQNGTFRVERKQIDWLAEAGDGVYSYKTEEGSIGLTDVRGNSSRILVDGSTVLDETGSPLVWSTFQVSYDLSYILFSADQLPQWRHSSHSNFYVHSLLTGKTLPLIRPSYPPQTAIARFSPNDHHIAFVYANDIYIMDGTPHQGRQAIRVTDNGNATTFNGVPGWVYEEEVFESDSATWWSPNGAQVAFLSTDEQLVPEFSFPVYKSSDSLISAPMVAYPGHTTMHYPKPGYPNPLVTLRVVSLSLYLSLVPPRPNNVDDRLSTSTVSLSFSSPFPPEDLVITEVAWVGEEELIVKMTNREAKIERVAYFVLEAMKSAGGEVGGRVVREVDWTREKGGDGGWVEPGQSIVGISSTRVLQSHVTNQDSTNLDAKDYPSGYLEVVPDSQGYRHIALFSPSDSNEPIFLTSGEWEIERGIEKVDVDRGIMCVHVHPPLGFQADVPTAPDSTSYFIAANPSIERHLYSVPLPTIQDFAALKSGGAPKLATVLSDTRTRSRYSTKFSPSAGFYVLNYLGPEIPWQRLVKVDDASYENVLTDNAELAATDATFQKAQIVYTTVEADGIEMNVMELRPPRMDHSGKTQYPVLFQVYGGPASQKVSTAFDRDWHHFLATSLGYLIVTVDPQGTGLKGRKFRVGVRDRLGELEANDTISAARYYAALPFVDETKVGIWGWSYGGYLTSKVIESNSSVFTLGMAVAPVTDWRFYDSVYTERYMSSPKQNPAGYASSAVVKMDGFKNVDFALAQGTADDNVHWQNSANLINQFTTSHVRNYRLRTFIDSDHTVSTRGAYWELMNWLQGFLVEKWGDARSRKKEKWSIDVRGR